MTKELEEYAIDVIKNHSHKLVKNFTETDLINRELTIFKAGYNKANEWHYVKNRDLPNKELEEKQLLVRVRNYTKDYIFAYYILDKYYSKNGKRFYSDTDCDYPIDIEDIIAWKEIVPTKGSEINDYS